MDRGSGAFAIEERIEHGRPPQVARIFRLPAEATIQAQPDHPGLATGDFYRAFLDWIEARCPSGEHAVSVGLFEGPGQPGEPARIILSIRTRDSGLAASLATSLGGGGKAGGIGGVTLTLAEGTDVASEGERLIAACRGEIDRTLGEQSALSRAASIRRGAW